MIVNVPTNRTSDNPYQPRMLYADVEDLAASILSMKNELKATKGLIQVPNGRLVIDGQPAPFSGSLPPDNDQNWSVELSIGHRRLRAFRFLEESDADYATMPVNVIPLDDRTMDNLAWDENVVRTELSPVEKARALQRTLDKFSLSQADLAKQRRMSPSAVSNALRLLKLPEALLSAIHEGKLTERHGVRYLPILDITEADLKLAKGQISDKTNFGVSWEGATPGALARRMVEINDVTADQVEAIVSRTKQRVDEAKKRAWNEQQAREQARARASEPEKQAPTMVATPSAPVPIPGLPARPVPAAESDESGADEDNEFAAEARQEIMADEAPQTLPETSPAPQPLVMPRKPRELPVIILTARISRVDGSPTAFTLSIAEGNSFPQFFNGPLDELPGAVQHAVALFIPPQGETPVDGEQILMEMPVEPE